MSQVFQTRGNLSQRALASRVLNLRGLCSQTEGRRVCRRTLETMSEQRDRFGVLGGYRLFQPGEILVTQLLEHNEDTSGELDIAKASSHQVLRVDDHRRLILHFLFHVGILILTCAEA